MNAYDLIMKKKRGAELCDDEIREFISSYTEGRLPDYQAAAMLMAICFRGLNERETATLTEAMADSGDRIDLSEFGALSADKHSTGGVGDKTTLIVAPIAATLGCKIAKMSGRGLGHTGGTVDKLEAFPGYKTTLSPNDFFDTVRRIGVSVIGQSGNLAPADKKLYALRDVTATVDSIPLISSSIMSKKLAAGARNIVLDVKCGNGAFMKTEEDAEKLAETMVKIGAASGRKVSAVITDMNTPLGFAVGNTLELVEAISVLRGNGPEDLTEVSVILAAEMARLALGIDEKEALARAKQALDSGAAFNKFCEWISAQGADESYAQNTALFKKASTVKEIRADKSGFISRMDAEKIGVASVELGAGRKTKDDAIDFSAGIILKKKTGDKISAGEVLAELHTNAANTAAAEKIFLDAIEISDEKPKKAKLILKHVKA